MHYGRQRHERQIAKRDFQGARCQSKLRRGASNRFEAGTVGRRVTELANPRQTYLAPEIAADHPEACRAAVHLVDLQNMIDFADALAAFAKQPALVLERLFFSGFARSLLS